MAKKLIRDATIFYSGRDVSGETNRASFEVQVAAVEDDNFTAGKWPAQIGGAHTGSMSVEGMTEDDGTLESTAFAGETNAAVIVPARPPVVGEVAYHLAALRSSFELRHQIRNLKSYQLSLTGESGGGRGKVLAYQSGVAAPGSEQPIQLGPVPLGRKLFAQLHVFAVSAPGSTLDAKVQSDDHAGFATPVDRLAFSQASTAGAFEVVSTDGSAISDNHWRIDFAVGGGATFGFVVAAGLV